MMGKIELPDGFNPETDGPGAVFSLSQNSQLVYDELIAAGVAAANKQPEDMTDYEKLGVAMAAGCKIEIARSDYSCVLRTVNRVSFEMVDGRLRVTEHPR